ncbi:MAG: hypothetical protein A2289_18515 [Deltaproteobacteria bacterium RIFOXYA12_FULL_58_15]|nr:MAG: hypothetical protein A2289_18515 [Deltaproteobacteria bacterium RIFOXYA12_FULL_58_15]OGR10603.1 MAG: hypothetical protein A2341_09645 [Deltaproteobacteria bacterium RIFOXYB12_FULL_58_9]
MRLMLIRSPAHFSSLIYPDGPWVGVPLNLLYLAAAAKKVPGVEVEILDALAYPDFAMLEQASPPVLFGLSPEEIAKRARDYKADVVGITSAAETFYDDALRTIELCRKLLPESFVIVGGTDVSLEPERYLRDAPGLDAVVVGEGEIALAGLLHALQEGTDWKAVPGLGHIKEDGSICINPATVIENLDDYAPVWAGLDFEQYFRLNREGYPSRPYIDYPGSDRAVFVITSRGCPFRCSFCSIHPTMGYRYRTHSPEFVVSQMKMLAVEHGIRHFHFEDDNLSLDRARFHAILAGLAEADLGITWDTPNGIRADRFDEELVDLCKRTGCIYLNFGIESGCQEVLDGIANKDLRLEEVEKTLALCKKSGIDTMALFIMGFPGETKDTVMRTYEYAFRIMKQHGTVPFYSIYRPYPGTPLYEKCEREGWLIDARPYERMGKIPYMLFMPTMVETPDLDIWYIVDRYQRYMIRFAAGVIFRALRVFLPHPLFLSGQIFGLAKRLVMRPTHFMATVRSFFWRVLLYPRGRVAQLGRHDR